MRAWIFQDHRQKKRLGDQCPWSVGWVDPAGKRKSKKMGSKSMAEKHARKIEGQLAAGIYEADNRKQWSEFRKEYELKISPRLDEGTGRIVKDCFKHFERIINPKRMDSIKTQALDEYISVRQTEPGKKKDSVVSPATINKELRHLKAAFRVANDWGYLKIVPKVRMLREPERLPRYVTPEDFAKIYGACDKSTYPKGLGLSPTDWWRALIVLCYMTGWRISEPLALLRDDLDLDGAKAITRADDNKGNRDSLVPLHPVVVEHLRKIAGFGPLVFPWNQSERTLWDEFSRIQAAAEIYLPCNGKHEHTDACHLYGFHDLRRAFATQNADRLSADALQALMRHKSYATTKRYISVARQLSPAVAALHVPAILAKKA